MKNLISAVFFLALAFFVGSELYQRAIEKNWLSGSFPGSQWVSGSVLATKDNLEKTPSLKDWEAPNYPVRIELRNREGRHLRVNLLGRDATHIYFLRHGDDEEFRYAISELNASSRKQILVYPQSRMNVQQKQSRKLHALHVGSLEAEIARIDERLSVINREHKVTKSKAERRTLMREYEGLKAKRLTFENEILEYK